MRIITLFLILLLLCCSNENEQHQVLDQETFIQLYCDVISKADFLKYEQKEVFVDSVLTHYHVTRITFENTIHHYNKNPNEWQEVFENIIKELENRMQQRENVNKPDTTITKKHP